MFALLIGLAASIEVGPNGEQGPDRHLALHAFSRGDLAEGLSRELDWYQHEFGLNAAGISELSNASLLLLTSGLDAHGIGIARRLLNSGDVHSIGCDVPQYLLHNDAEYAIGAPDVRKFLGCCLQNSGLLDALITDRKASVNAANDYGYTPLHFAAMADQPWLVSELVKNGASLTAGTMFGATPLHLAAMRNATLAIKELVKLIRSENKVMLKERDAGGGTEGRTAADVACRLGFTYAAKLIEPGRDCGAKAKPLYSVIGPDNECGFDVRGQGDLGAANFIREYVAIGKPVLIKGKLSGAEPSGLGAWFSGARWSLETLRSRWGHVSVNAGDIPHAKSFGKPSNEMRLAEYIEKVLQYHGRKKKDGSGAADGAKKKRVAAGKPDRSIVLEAFAVDDPNSLAHGFQISSGSVLDPEVTGMWPQRVHMVLGPRSSGAPMRYAKAHVDILVRGSRTWLLQAPSQASYSFLHPADATKTAPWPWPKEDLYSCNQEAGDILYVPDMWARALINDEESLGFVIETETGAGEFSPNLESK